MAETEDVAETEDAAEIRIVTVGHGTASIEEFIELLEWAQVAALVDIRSYPSSRHNPQFGQDALRQSLTEAGIDYEWQEKLGGRRKPVPGSIHVGLRHVSFRAYADWMQTSEFAAGIEELLALVARQQADKRVAIMCSESVWWRCHRRLVADHLTLIEQVEVRHLMHDHSLREVRITPEVRVAGSELIYDGGQEQLPLG